ncbi:MAG TPA: hypothetical protein VLS25_05250 [Dehalococcoidia bacterium]|nr:hypothetical protein [Dehalococcoidia bacterium]
MTRPALGAFLALVLWIAGTTACTSDKELKDLTTVGPSASAAPTTVAQPADTHSPTPVPTEKPNVNLSENGFNSYVNSLNQTTVVWAAVLENKSATQQALDTKVTALFYDANNVLLDTDDQTARIIFPAETSAVGSTLVSVTSAPVRMEVRVSGTKFQTPNSTASLTIGQASFVQDPYSPMVTANIQNPFGADIKNLGVICIITDAAGAYLGVGEGYVDLLPAGTTAQAQCRVDSRLNLGAMAVARLFPSFGFIASLETPR